MCTSGSCPCVHSAIAILLADLGPVVLAGVWAHLMTWRKLNLALEVRGLAVFAYSFICTPSQAAYKFRTRSAVCLARLLSQRKLSCLVAQPTLTVRFARELEIRFGQKNLRGFSLLSFN